jgi:hypothetical protein
VCVGRRVPAPSRGGWVAVRIGRCQLVTVRAQVLELRVTQRTKKHPQSSWGRIVTCTGDEGGGVTRRLWHLGLVRGAADLAFFALPPRERRIVRHWARPALDRALALQTARGFLLHKESICVKSGRAWSRASWSCMRMSLRKYRICRARALRASGASARSASSCAMMTSRTRSVSVASEVEVSEETARSASDCRAPSSALPRTVTSSRSRRKGAASALRLWASTALQPKSSRSSCQMMSLCLRAHWMYVKRSFLPFLFAIGTWKRFVCFVFGTDHPNPTEW